MIGWPETSSPQSARSLLSYGGSYLQRQIDVYGEVLDWALLYDTLGGRFDRDSKLMLSALADHVADHWREPDQGLWELRGPPRHFVHGKIMSWVALDRAVRLLGNSEKWLRERDLIAAEVVACGVLNGHLIQSYEHSGLDAALLLAPMVAFPIDQGILQSTVECIVGKLQSGAFVYRYHHEDGLEGKEGAFVICSFWLVDALLSIGRQTEAKALFQRLVAHTSDVGLNSEEIEPATGEFLGNFPQANTHLALVCSVANLFLYDELGPDGLKGTHADRAKRMIAATFGWRGVWSAFKATWKIGRIVSSRASILDLS
jgi:GH15 family glucan-1,4-alpha-glucosidase